MPAALSVYALQNSGSEIVQRLLIDFLGLGSDPTNVDPTGAPLLPWPVYYTNTPDAIPVPDDVITVFDTLGQDDGRSMIDGELLAHWGFMVKVRSVDHPTGWLKATAIRDALATAIYRNYVTTKDPANTYFVHAVVKIGQVLVLGTESPNSRRRLFTLNCLLLAKPHGSP